MAFGRKSSHDHEPAEPAASPWRSLGLIANSMLVLLFVLPIITSASIFLAVNFQFWKGFAGFDPLNLRIERAHNANGVVSGDDPEALKALYRKLQSKTASRDAAQRSDAVHIVFQFFEDRAPHRRVTLDLSGIGDAAAVFISDRPVSWVLEGAAGKRAKIGFEGPFAFDLDNAHDELLAGFRVGVFGAGETVSPQDYIEFRQGRAQMQTVCAAVRRWQRYFGVGKTRIFVWSVRNAQQVVVKDRSILVDGRSNPDFRGIARTCAR